MKHYSELSDMKLVKGIMHPKGKLVAENLHRSREQVRKLADGVSKGAILDKPELAKSWEHVAYSSDEAYAAMAKEIRKILERIRSNPSCTRWANTQRKPGRISTRLLPTCAKPHSAGCSQKNRKHHG